MAIQQTTGGASLFSPPYVRLAFIAVVVWLALTVLFHLLPQIDIAVSSWFFVQEACPAGSAATACGRFPIAADPFWAPLRTVFHRLPVVVGVLIAVGVGIALARGLSQHRLMRPALVAIATLLLGPGLIVNLVFKEMWGRPRPVETDLFGGGFPFVPAGRWSDYCVSNCSFVSGESSAMFWLLCLVPLVPLAWRRPAGVVLFALAALAAGMRVAFGAHYLSDIVLGALATGVAYIVALALAERYFRAKAA